MSSAPRRRRSRAPPIPSATATLRWKWAMATCAWRPTRCSGRCCWGSVRARAKSKRRSSPRAAPTAVATGTKRRDTVAGSTITTTTMSIEALTRLLQLASPALPVGAYSYSGGLEAALEAGVVHDAPSAECWIGAVLEHSVARMEAPVLLRLVQAFREGAPAQEWNDRFLASRESAELRADTV